MTGKLHWNVGRLRDTWRSDTKFAAHLNAALDSIGFDEAYAATVTATRGKKKYLKDSVWGMIEFGHAEIQLIDSPLLQRLRGIHQLGFSYLVYPSAEHTRFIHSLGMAHVVSSFLASIVRNAGAPILGPVQTSEYTDITTLLPLTPTELVFAALLHDVGHMPFSHACESALTQQDTLFSCGGTSLADFLTTARYAFGKSISLSEALSILIVLSNRFGDYYARLNGFDQSSSDESLVRVACLIAGVQATDSCPNIHELISAAAIDADKIDYVARDAAACGIAVGVDVSRIFMGSGLVTAQRDAYDPSYKGDARGTVFVVNSSGADTLDEIVQARSALYQRVYLHPVTRTAEALLSRALHQNAEGTTSSKRVDLTDALGLWALDDASLLHGLSEHGDASVASLARKLRRRTLPKKACVLAGAVAMMQVPLRGIFPRLDPNHASAIKKDVANTFIEKLRRENIQDIGAATIETRIKAEAGRLATALATGSMGHLVPSMPLDSVVVTPIAAMDGSRPDALVFQAGELIRTPALTNVQGQHDAQDIFKAVGYVFCDPDWRALVLVAARRVVFELSQETAGEGVRHRLMVAESTVEVEARQRTILELEAVTRRANIVRSRVETVMRAAADVGYFDETPVLYLPTKSDEPEIQTIVKTFRAFSGELGWSVDKNTVAAFVDQFPPSLRHPMLEMLQRGTLLDQPELTGSLRNAISQARQGDEPVVVCPLSASSGGEAVTIINTAGLPNVRVCTSLNEALNVAGNPLILLADDNASSGVQSAAQLFAYAGIDRGMRPAELAGEDGLYEHTLEPEEVGSLSARRFAIVVAAGLDDADTRTRGAAQELGFDHFEGVKYGKQIAHNLQWPPELQDYLSGVGRELLAYRYGRCVYAELGDEALAKRCEDRSFGYAGRGGIMVTHGNVPSSTVTALWQPGLFKRRPWTPLFVRRGLLKDLVLG
jgi:HD superfamily phosphohydrolase